MKNEEEKLEFIFNNITKWLSFAEAKNAALITLNITIIIGLFQLLPIVASWRAISSVFYGFISYILILIIVSLLISLMSFFPSIHQIYNRWILPKKDVKENIIFFGHLNKLDKEQLLKSIDVETNRFNIDIAEQIISNSKICFVKYELFKISLLMTLVALFPPTIFYLIWNIYQSKN